MSKELLENLEREIRKRNPVLAERLQSGLSEARILKLLKRANVEGRVDPVVRLFAWKNGSLLDPSITLEQATPFPNSPYIFLDLEMMLGHFRGFEKCLPNHPRYAKIIGRYFPLFWNGSDCWMAVDLEPSGQNRLILINTETEKMLEEAYGSFEEFLKDAIRSNKENSPLICF